MRIILLTAVAAIVLAGPVFSQEPEITEEANPCDGTWIVQQQGGWVVVRQEDGLTKSIPPSATILDCGGRNGTLKDHMNNIKAVVRCSNSSDQDGVFHVRKIQITCE